MTADMTYDTGFRPLKGSQKVAALLLVMGKPLASRLLGHFDSNELKSITRAAAELGSVPLDVLEELVEEFAGEFTDGMDLKGDPDQAEGLLAGVLPPEQVADIMSDVRGSSNNSIWEKIAALSPNILTDYLVKQHPQVLALCLSKLSVGGAAAVMELLPAERRTEVTRRLLALAPVADAALRVIESRINLDIILNPAAPAGTGTARMASIFNKMAPEQVEEVLKSLETDQPEEAEALRSKLFSFDDLVTLPAKTRQALFEKVPSDKIVTALANKDPEFCANVLSSLTARARRLVENELASAGGTPAKDIAAALRFISDTLLGMADRGEVELREDEG